MDLRDYQKAGVEAVWQYFADGNDGNPIIAMPTGTGKSVVIAALLHSIFDAYPNQKIMMVTHVKELIEQNFEKLLLHWPTAPAGIYSAGLGRKETDPKIIFGGIGSVRSCPELFGHVDLLVIDECHLVSPKSDTSYRQFINKLKEINPHLKVIGLTATQYRLGLGSLLDGGLFTDICFDMTTLTAFNWLVSEGYISPLVPKKTTAELNVDGVRINGGEFVMRDLQKAVDKDEITYAALTEAMEMGHDREHWLVFATGIEHAENIAGMLNTKGVSCAVVHSKMAAAERDKNIEDFKAGRIRALINNNVLTTGFDVPWIDLIVVLRPTTSTSLWVQMLGRGTRVVYAPGFDVTTKEGRLAAIANGGKRNCMVLDFAKNTPRLGPINDPVLPRKKGEGGGVAPVRLCPHCLSYVHASLRFCNECGEEFPINVKFGVFAGTEALMVEAKDQPQVEVFTVDKVVYSCHKKQGAPDSILATYYAGLRRFKEYICIEHGGHARTKAGNWWKQHTALDVPISVANALALSKHLSTPKRIRVWVNKKYPEILGYEFD